MTLFIIALILIAALGYLAQTTGQCKMSDPVITLRAYYARRVIHHEIICPPVYASP